MKRRGFKFLAFVCGFAVLVGGIRVFIGGERLLLQRAVELRLEDVDDNPNKSEKDTNDDSEGYTWQRQWMPNGKVAELHLNRAHHPILYSIARHDLHTGATTIKPIPFGEELEERYSDPALSPNGQWLMWHTTQKGEIVRAWNVVTGHRLRWRVEDGDYRHFENHWFADNHRWLEYATVPGYVTLHDIQNPQQNIRMTLPPLQNGQNTYEEYDQCVLTTRDRLLTFDEQVDQTRGPVTAVTFHEFALQPEQGKVVRLKTYRNILPTGLKYIRHAISPDGSRILWQVEGIPESTLQHWLESKLPHPPPRKQTWVGLWTSRLDGDDWREIGHIVLPYRGEGDDADEGDADSLFESGWMQDCKTVWLKYQDTYYSVATE